MPSIDGSKFSLANIFRSNSDSTGSKPRKDKKAAKLHRNGVSLPAVPQDGASRSQPAGMQNGVANGTDGHAHEGVTTMSVQMPVPQPYTLGSARTRGSITATELAVATGAQLSRTEKLLDAAEDAIPVVDPSLQMIVDTMKPALTTLDTAQTRQTIERGVQHFMEDIPWLMKALDDVAKIHPFVSVAVLAFKAVYTLELTRRENDKRIISLYVEMKDMITVLVQLRGVKDPNDIGLDGRTIEARLQGLSQQTAEDIKDCANTCDIYSRKKLLVKVLRGLDWEEKLRSFIRLFTKRRAEFEFALACHNARTVDELKVHSDEMKVKLAALDDKMDIIMKMFAKFMTSDEKQLASKVEEMGGIKLVLNNDTVLKELTASDPDRRRVDGPSGAKVSASALDDLKTELGEDLENAMKRNLKNFEAKFELQKKQIEKVAREEGDRVIGAVTGFVSQGPHDKIKDAELRELWHNMNWRGNVKTRLFVLTLRDHFREKAMDAKKKAQHDDQDNADTGDTWALDYLGGSWTRIQPMMEAFDDDASGYISITEINQFIELCPPELNWSFPRWLAYWAIGWRVTATEYRDKIQGILQQMLDMLSQLLPENRYCADRYLTTVWPIAVTLTMSLDRDYSYLQGRFQEYVDIEEERIQKNLEAVHYRIDAVDTLYLMVGSGRIEKSILVLLYLLVKHDLEKFLIAQSKDAVGIRYDELKELYSQQKLDLDQQFSTIAARLFRYWHDSSELWSADDTKRPDWNDYWYTLDDPGPASDPEVILKYPLELDYPFDCSVYEDQFDSVAAAGLETTIQVQALLGTWNGFLFTDDEYPLAPMCSFHFRVSTRDDVDFEASGKDFDGYLYTVSGRCIPTEEGTVKVTFTYISDNQTEYFSGCLDEASSIIGTWGRDEDTDYHYSKLILRKIPWEVMCSRPSPSAFDNNMARALWRFAISAVLYQVRRSLWSWSFFRERRDNRRRFIALNIRNWTYGRTLNSEETTEYLRLRQSFSAEDASFYRSIRDYQLRIIPRHHEYLCDYCGGSIGGGRIICLDCPTPQAQFWRPTTFCDDERCVAQAVTVTKAYGEKSHLHLPTHDLMKVRTVLHRKDIPQLTTRAKWTLERCRTIIEPSHDASNLSDERQGSPGRLQLDNVRLESLQPTSFIGTGEAKTLRTIPYSQEDGSSSLEGQLGGPEALQSHAHEVDDSSNCSRPLDLEVLPENHLDETKSTSAEGTGVAENRPVEDTQREDMGGLNIMCNVCETVLNDKEFWFCMECEEHYICDDCDSKFLLACTICRHPYTQPTWYYGKGPNDNFMCHTCSTQGRPPWEELEKESPHVYTHPLVRCKKRVFDVRDDQPRSMDQRLSILEEKVIMVDKRLSQIERGLEAILSKLDGQPQPNGVKQLA
ncbi:hypothetical protein AcV7_000168 [Taiwanofungus camphoratus]|nr:hypothetical protein AcV7_000168 [Antrodia cinnamomea]